MTSIGTVKSLWSYPVKSTNAKETMETIICFPGF